MERSEGQLFRAGRAFLRKRLPIYVDDKVNDRFDAKKHSSKNPQRVFAEDLILGVTVRYTLKAELSAA